MRYFLKKPSKKLTIVIDNNPRNIMDFIKEAKAGLLGNGVDNKVKLV